MMKRDCMVDLVLENILSSIKNCLVNPFFNCFLPFFRLYYSHLEGALLTKIKEIFKFKAQFLGIRNVSSPNCS